MVWFAVVTSVTYTRSIRGIICKMYAYNAAAGILTKTRFRRGGGNRCVRWSDITYGSGISRKFRPGNYIITILLDHSNVQLSCTFLTAIRSYRRSYI